MKFILLLFSVFVSIDCFSQDVFSTKVILSNHGLALKNNDTIIGMGSRMLAISLASNLYKLVETEFAVIVKRGKTNVLTKSGQGKEISLVDLGVYSKSGDMLYIEIKKLKTSNPGIVIKPSNNVFKIYLK